MSTVEVYLLRIKHKNVPIHIMLEMKIKLLKLVKYVFDLKNDKICKINCNIFRFVTSQNK